MIFVSKEEKKTHTFNLITRLHHKNTCSQDFMIEVHPILFAAIKHILGHEGQTGKVKLHNIAFLTNIFKNVIWIFHFFFIHHENLACFYYCKEGKYLFSKTVSL